MTIYQPPGFLLVVGRDARGCATEVVEAESDLGQWGGRADISLTLQGPHDLALGRAGHELVAIIGHNLGDARADWFLKGMEGRRRRASDLLRDRSLDIIGHWCLVSIAANRVAVATDHMGTYPVFQTTMKGRPDLRVVGTDLTRVADVSGRQQGDVISLREFVARGAVTSPHTTYDGVTRLWPGTVAEADAPLEGPIGEFTSVDYWRPRRGTEPSPKRCADLAGECREVFLSNAERIVDSSSRILVMASGGEDSRVIAAALARTAAGPTSIEAAIFLDGRNREYHVCRLALRILGVPLGLRLRSADHYTAGLAERIASVGLGLGGLEHGHSLGLCDPNEADLFVDGWAADTLYKAMYAPQRQREYRGFKLGLAKPVSVAGRASDSDVSDAWAQRLVAKKEQLQGFRPEEDVGSWTHIWPVSDKPTYGFFSANRSYLPSVSPYLFGNLVDSAAGVPESAKLDRRFFHKAFGRWMRAAGLVPRTGGDVPILGPRTNLVVRPVVDLAFRLSSRLGRRGEVGSGPWQRRAVREQAVTAELASVPAEILEATEKTVAYRQAQESIDSRNIRLLQIARAVDADLLRLPAL